MKRWPTWEMVLPILALYFQFAFLIVLGIGVRLGYGGSTVFDEQAMAPLSRLVFLWVGPMSGLLAGVGTFFLLTRCRPVARVLCVLFLCLPAIAASSFFSCLLLVVFGPF